MSESDMERWWQRPFYSYDIETTGVDVFADRIVTATLTRMDPTTRERRLARTWVADPGIEVPEGAARIHGYTTERVRAEGRPIAEVMLELAEALLEVFDDPAEPALVIYNAPFDTTMTGEEMQRHLGPGLAVPRRVVDPLVLDKQVNRRVSGKGGRQLVRTCGRYGIELSAEDAHTSEGDTLAAARLAWVMMNRHPELGAMDLADLHDAQVGWYRSQQLDLAAWKRRRGEIESATRIALEAEGWPIRPRP